MGQGVQTRLRRALAVALVLTGVGTGPAAPRAQAQGAQVEGVRVHGHWIIEVRNANGTVAERREFENALMTSGAMTLGGIMAGQTRPGYWAVGLSESLSSVANSPCTVGACVLVPPGSTTDASLFPTLTVSLNPPGSLAGTLSLDGNFTATKTGIIAGVFTEWQVCSAAQSCPVPLFATPLPVTGIFSTAQPLGRFTTTSISPLTVQSGQIVQVTVAISFS
ncbi:MAG: hypothetical protein U0Q55_22700 [Vicinamibacterales bacterium]